MANTAHLVRRQSSRDLKPQKSVDKLEMKELRGRLVGESRRERSLPERGLSYGATNAGFDDSSPNRAAQSAKSTNPFVDVQSKQTISVSDAGGGGGSTSAGGSKLGSTEKGIFKPEAGEDERENWDSKLTFLLATVGYAVGLGNVWRFPYLAQKNGGGAFLIPYFVMLAIEGIPIFYLELAIGQRLRKGAIGVWNQVSPFMGGIGVSSAVVSFNVALYYNTIIAWCLFYFVQSFQSELPWAECPNKYFQNGSYSPEPECLQSSPTQYFWYRTTLMVSKDINTPDVFNWKIALALVVAWILVYMCMIKGIASSGKVVYVTATFPYIVLIIFFFRGVTLPGMSDGLRHLFTPKWYTLTDPVVWLEAGTQIFFSLGLAFGGLIAFSSYNPVNNNCYRDAIMVSLTNCFTSMFAGIVVFSIIGFKATMTYEACLRDRNSSLISLFGGFEKIPLHLPANGSVFNLTNPNGSLTSLVMPTLPECDLQKELDNSASGTGLAFIIFTEAINQFPGAQFWSVLFFLMLFTLGIDSQFGTLEGVVTSIVDMKLFPNLRKEILTGGICLVCCSISMAFAHGAGSYVFVLFDNFSGNFPLLIIAFFECIGVAYVYGIKRFADDIELMTGTRPGLYWLICWKYLSPLAMLSILVASIVEIVVQGSGYQAWVAEKGITERLEWPTWALVLIAVLILASILWIPVVGICRMFNILIVEDNEKAWFPAADLKEFHGIVPHETTKAEQYLFCIRPDGSEGLCCPTSGPREDDEEDDTDVT
ncbi:sodium-dependent neutral amino acid transporter B(0)AT3 isoform X1 [Trichogramma pretiosum]|uniref:sodium-dependent neutral amino acid transporter B(0)AT3 isoform X1 n=1 Tax=Trichogramma pretiosum TaxID=7493 RepID=UPI0006C9828A|nr:sodium-dependent neutral amino acid transporter B(0)AT3 isoform X1 [Trichogramma pretiosum]